jgi:hypothetical protein
VESTYLEQNSITNYTKNIVLKDKSKGKEDYSIIMNKYMKDNFLMAIAMDLDFLSNLTGTNMKVNGQTIECMEELFLHSQMAGYTSEIIAVTADMEMDYKYLLMAVDMMKSGWMKVNIHMGYTKILKEWSRKDGGVIIN